jgi:hypothetical protein
MGVRAGRSGIRGRFVRLPALPCLAALPHGRRNAAAVATIWAGHFLSGLPVQEEDVQGIGGLHLQIAMLQVCLLSTVKG